MHWLKYVKLNRKDRLKICGAYSAIVSVYQCVTGSLGHEHSSLPLDVLDSD